METRITIEGIECATCSEEIEAELSSARTVENVFNGLHKKILFIHATKEVTKEKFLNSMKSIPEILNRVITKYECSCHCCADVQVDLSD